MSESRVEGGAGAKENTASLNEQSLQECEEGLSKPGALV